MKQAILKLVLKAREEKRPTVLLTHLESGSQAAVVDGVPTGDLDVTPDLEVAIAEARQADRSRSVETAEGPIFIQIFNPPLRLAIIGAVHIAQPLAPMASLAGYDVTVMGDWPDEGMTALAPDNRTAVVALTHDPKLDDPALDVALKSDAFYIAALGSRKTHAKRLERLAALGHSPDTLARIHGPAGLAVGAVSPAEIAIAIMAQMTSALRQSPHPAKAAA